MVRSADQPGLDHERLDPLRRNRGPIAEHYIDELVAGRLSRRQFLRYGSAVGLSIPLMHKMLGAWPGSSSRSAETLTSPLRSAAGKAGATIRAGIQVPSGAIDPITIDDEGALEVLGNIGEFLVFTDQQNNYHPWLATSWSANADASVWTFKIRKGVKFNDGTPMTVDDVIYSFKSQCTSKSSANALSVFGGTLLPDGVVKVDTTTVAFHLVQPDGGFIDAVSEDNYNMVIVPNNFDFSKYQTTMPGTGRFKMKSYTTSVGAVLVRNPYYWGTPALPSEVHMTFYPTTTPMVAALESDSIDCLDQFAVTTAPQLLDGSYTVISIKAATHRELSMRTDISHFKSKYVRQAIAYTLDRPAIVSSLFKGKAEVGNDNPFAPVFKSTVGPPGVPQRKQNLKLAKELLAKAGVSRGFKATLYTETVQEMPHFAEIVKASAAQIGIDITLVITTSSKYFGTGVIGKSNWLDGEMSLVTYGARAVPNVYLEAPLQTYNPRTGTGEWNAARFNTSKYDILSKEFIAAVDLSKQRSIAKQIETLLLDETPIIYAYFYDYLSATQKDVKGVYPTAEGQFFLWNASKT